MNVDVATRWRIDLRDAPYILTEIGSEEQIRNVVLNAIRKGVPDGMVEYSINDVQQRNKIPRTMQDQVDSAPIAKPRAGGGPFRIATLTAFFLRNLNRRSR